MSSIISRFIDTIYPSRTATQVIILGLDYSGKTTLLYRVKSGEVVQTIPTIGLSEETGYALTTNGKMLKMTAWDVGLRCGLGFLHPLFHHYISEAKALIWVVDSSDPERLLESVEFFEEAALSVSKTNGDAGDDKQDVPILILANKSDKAGAMSLDYLRVAFSKETSGKTVAFFSISLTEDTKLGDTGALAALDWLQLAIEAAQFGEKFEPKKRLNEKVVPSASVSTDITNKLESWLARVKTDSPPELFLEQFNSCTLPEWDHYTHIRIAYVILTSYGRKEGKDMIFKGLEKYISISPQTKKKSFHVTMTYFWIQIVHFGIRSMTPKTVIASYKLPMTLAPSPVAPDNFSQFLLTNPHVVDGNLWSDYYTKEIMMSSKAREDMILPDKRPLPNLVNLESIHTTSDRRRSI